MSSTFPRCNSTCDIQEQTQKVFTTFILQLGPGAALCRHSQVQTRQNLPVGWKPEATRAAEPKRTECVKFLRLRLDWLSPPDVKYPSESDLEYATDHLLGKHKLLRPSE